MNLSKVLIVGRPNVGKSSLFNRFLKKRIAIVHDEPGVTRDLLSGYFLFSADHQVELIDTGGLFHPNGYEERIMSDVRKTMGEADALFFVLDAQTGVTKEDLQVRQWLLRHLPEKRILVLWNKSEGKESLPETIGLGPEFLVSAAHGIGITEPIECLLERGLFRKVESSSDKEDPIRVALIGRPNVGKSTLFNQLFGKERAIVSPLVGTTRDPICEEIDGLCWIDTAGIRRRSKEPGVVEKFSFLRTEEMIKRSDVCILLADATEGLTEQDKKIAQHIVSEGKGAILFLNKWDQMHKTRMEHVQSLLRKNPTLASFEILVGSAKEGRNVNKIVDVVKKVYGNNRKRIPTGELNRWMQQLVQRTNPPTVEGRTSKIMYFCQVDIAPPKFLVSCNHPHLPASYLRFIENRLREDFSFFGTPIVIRTKGR